MLLLSFSYDCAGVRCGFDVIRAFHTCTVRHWWGGQCTYVAHVPAVDVLDYITSNFHIS
jgi:hypothetical protein